MKPIDFSLREIQIIAIVNLLVFIAYYSLGLSFLNDYSGGMDIVFGVVILFGAFFQIFLNVSAYGVAKTNSKLNTEHFAAGIKIAIIFSVIGLIAYPFSLVIMKSIHST